MKLGQQQELGVGADPQDPLDLLRDQVEGLLRAARQRRRLQRGYRKRPHLAVHHVLDEEDQRNAFTLNQISRISGRREPCQGLI